MNFEGSMQTLVNDIADIRWRCVAADADAKIASELSGKHKVLLQMIESLGDAITEDMRGSYNMMKRNWKKLSGKTIRPMDMDTAHIDAMLLCGDKVTPAKSPIQDPYSLLRCFHLSVLYNSRRYAQSFAEVDLKAWQEGDYNLPWAFKTRLAYRSPSQTLLGIEKGCEEDVTALMKACTEHLDKALPPEVCAMNAKILHFCINAWGNKWVIGVRVGMPDPQTIEVAIDETPFGKEVGRVLDSFASKFSKFAIERDKLKAKTDPDSEKAKDFIRAQQLIAFNNLMGTLEEMRYMFSVRGPSAGGTEYDAKSAASTSANASAGAAAAAPVLPPLALPPPMAPVPPPAPPSAVAVAAEEAESGDEGEDAALATMIAKDEAQNGGLYPPPPNG